MFNIESKCESSGRVIERATDKVIRIIRKVIWIIEIDQHYTNGNTNSSNVSKNDICTYKLR